MSRKSKLILATALFGAALFAASCGGGGGGGTTTTTGSGSGSGGGGGGGETPSPTEQGKVLALLDVGTVAAGTFKPVTICQLKSDNKAYCGNDLNLSEDADLKYLHEFPNGNVLLVKEGASRIGYFFNGSQVIKLDKYRPLGASSSTPETTEPGGITIPDPNASGTNVYVTPDFVILLTNSDKDLVVVTSSGKVIKDSHSGAMSVNAVCETVTKGGITYKLNVDGTSSSTTIPTTLASAGGKHLVQDTSSYKIYLSDSECSATGVLVDTITGVDDAQMVKVGNDFYIAVRADTTLKYYKVSGNTLTVLNTIALSSSSSSIYALDSNGVLYAVTTDPDTSDDRVEAFKPTDGSSAGYYMIPSADILLPLADRVLVRETATGWFEVSTTGSVVNARGLSTSLYAVLNRCTDATNTLKIDGVRTNFIRCLYDSGSTEALYSLAYNSGNYQGASYSLPGGSSTEEAQALFGVGKVLVRPGGSSTILLCNTTTTPTISCSATDLPDITTSIKKYLKVNGLDVFYTNSGGALKVGNVFDPPSSALPITVSSPSGGNASLDLNKFAFSFRPAGAPCATQIVYFSSRTASQKTYTIAQPSTCVTRILKTFP